MLLNGNRSVLSYRKSSIKPPPPPNPLSNKPSPFKGKKVNKPPLSIIIIYLASDLVGGEMVWWQRDRIRFELLALPAEVLN